MQFVFKSVVFFIREIIENSLLTSKILKKYIWFNEFFIRCFLIIKTYPQIQLQHLRPDYIQTKYYKISLKFTGIVAECCVIYLLETLHIKWCGIANFLIFHHTFNESGRSYRAWCMYRQQWKLQCVLINTWTLALISVACSDKYSGRTNYPVYFFK